MSAERRLNHIWHAIIRNAFAPCDSRTRAAWLHCFAQSIYRYVDNSTCEPHRNQDKVFTGKIECSSLDFTCKYEIGQDRSQFDFFLSSLPSPSWHSQYGIESTVFASGASALETYRDPPCQDEVDKVLRGLIDHPRLHLHLFSDPERHEVRIATGLHEPLLFLFQLRFQLCIDPDRRQIEMDRLRNLFTLNWLQQEHSISPQRLFGL